MASLRTNPNIKVIGRNDPCFCGSGKKYKFCHQEIDEKMLQYRRKGCIVPGRRLLKSKSEIEMIKESARINIAVLDYVAENIKVGMSTEEINTLVHEKTIEMGGIPAPLNYQGFPKSVCTSINNQVCHGIPSKDIILRDGDIINVDCSTILNGFYSDSSRMFCIGEVSEERKRLVEKCREAVYLGLEQVKPWNFIGDMSQVINDFAKANGYSIVEEIGGHGIGLEFHEDPYVCYVAEKGTEMLMVPGMMFTIEPMMNMGTAEIFIDDDNGWTAYTDDGMDSAQWELQVLVTEDGHEIISY